MMDSSSETKLMDLPVTLQLNILNLISWKDVKNVRLVSKHTSALINHLGLPAQINVSEISRQFPVPNVSPDLLKTSTFPRIKSIEFSWTNKPLPIYSSTRMLIPKANLLTICNGVSPDNVLKLIRYYAQHCKKLHLYKANLPIVKSIRMFGSNKCLSSITEFTFTDMYSEPPSIRSFSYYAALNQFLSWTEMPSLKKLKFNIYFEREDDININDPKFFGSLFYFFKQHANQLISLTLELTDAFWPEIIKYFELLVNVKDLSIYDYDGEDDEWDGLCFSGYPSVEEAFRNFTKLESLFVYISPLHHNRLMKHLMTINKTTIRSVVTITDHDLSLDWLYNSPPASNLRILHLNIIYQNSALFEEAQNINFRLKHLRKLSINMSQGDQEPELSWCDLFTKWLIRVAPNLRLLDLRWESSGHDSHNAQLSIANIINMIMELKVLNTIKLSWYGIHPVSPELVDWFNQNPQTYFTWIENRTEEPYSNYNYVISICKIQIDRPYIQEISVTPEV